jgi:hypothetical protein
MYSILAFGIFLTQIGSADPVFMLDPEFGPTTCIRTGIRLEVSASGTLGGITALALVLALVQVGEYMAGVFRCGGVARACINDFTAERMQGFVLLSVGDIVVRWFADRLYRRHQHYLHLTKHEVSPDSRVESPPFWSGEPFSALRRRAFFRNQVVRTKRASHVILDPPLLPLKRAQAKSSVRVRCKLIDCCIGVFMFPIRLSLCN